MVMDTVTTGGLLRNQRLIALPAGGAIACSPFGPGPLHVIRH